MCVCAGIQWTPIKYTDNRDCLALLQHVVDQYPTRHLGLKFTNHRSLEEFYESAGFKRIGVDSLYTYMAIKRD